jgi:hypothetical protein
LLALNKDGAQSLQNLCQNLCLSDTLKQAIIAASLKKQAEAVEGPLLYKVTVDGHFLAISMERCLTISKLPGLSINEPR